MHDVAFEHAFRLAALLAQITSNSSHKHALQRFERADLVVDHQHCRLRSHRAHPVRSVSPFQQIRGNCSPDSQSTMRPPPKRRRHLHEVMLVLDDLADASPRRGRADARASPRAARPPPPARRSPRACPHWRHRADRARAIRRRRRPPAAPESASSSMRKPTLD